MRSALFLLVTALVVVVLCWLVKYGGVENVTIRVLDKTTGDPIDSYWVFYHARPHSNWRREPEIERMTQHLSLAIPREDLGHFDIWLAAPGYRPQLLRPADMSWSGWLRSGETVLAMEPGTTLKGVVRDAAGQPVKDAAILSEMRPAMENPPLPEPLARTGADGTFESPDVRPFIEDVKAFKEGLGAGHCAVSEAMDISIHSGGVTCRMLEAGKPIVGLWVIAESHANTGQDSSRWWQATQKTNTEGLVRFDAFPPGRTRIWTQQIYQDGAWQNYFLFDYTPKPSGSVFMLTGPPRKLEKWVNVEKDKTVACSVDALTDGDKP